jgi:hypothetical protein
MSPPAKVVCSNSTANFGKNASLLEKSDGTLDIEQEWASLDIAAIQRLLDFANKSEAHEGTKPLSDSPTACDASPSPPPLPSPKAAAPHIAASITSFQRTAPTRAAADAELDAAEEAANEKLVNAALEELESLELKEAQVHSPR